MVTMVMTDDLGPSSDAPSMTRRQPLPRTPSPEARTYRQRPQLRQGGGYRLSPVYAKSPHLPESTAPSLYPGGGVSYH